MIHRCQQATVLPPPGEFVDELPVNPDQRAFIHASRLQIRDILHGRTSRKLLIVGPCSIHNISEAREYANRLKTLSERLKDTFFVVMRTYFEKPRTAVGWKGLLYDPHLDGQSDLRSGLTLARRFLLEMAHLELPAATEFLDPMVPYYLGDLISWACVGARTASSQVHRQMASLLPLPVGFKNAIDGDSRVAMNSILSATTPHTLFGLNQHGQIAQLQSSGNPHCHLVLRGGDRGPNFDSLSIHQAVTRLKAMGLISRLLVDCSHDNSGRDHRVQSKVFESVISQIVEEGSSIAGILMESYLCSGNQSLSPSQGLLRYGVSLTDSCMDWESTETLLTEAHGRINQALAPSLC